MALVDKSGYIEFPYSRDEVFDALSEAVLQLRGMKVKMANKNMGNILLSTGVSLASWGEDITIQLTETSPGQTSLSVLSSSKLPTTLIDFGKNRRNIEMMIQQTWAILARIYHIKTEGTLPCIAELLIRKGFIGTLQLSGRKTSWVKAKKAV